MTTRLSALCFDARDPARLARFWASTLGWEIADESDGEVELIATDGTPFCMLFLPVADPSSTKSVIHLDLVSESVEHQQQVVDRLVGLGATHADIGQGDQAWVVLADPEGNEFCIVVRGDFFADTGFLGAVVFEPASHGAGHFWSAATGWPVVYDEGGDTAIRAPDGKGPFLTFGPPAVDKRGKNRLHLDVAPYPDDEQSVDVERLIALGAHTIDIGQGDQTWVVLADPDGNEFCVLRPQ